MAITFVNAGAEGSAASGNITLGAPASPQNGDIWIAVVHSSDQVAHSMSGDWTQIVQGNGGGTTSRLSVWWHRYNGVTPSLVVTHSAGQSPIGGIAAFRGCVTSGSPVAAVGSIGTGTTATIAHPGIATTGEIMHLLCNGAADDNNRTLVTNYTNAFEDSGAGTNNAFVTTAGTPDGSVCLMYRLVTDLANSTINMTQAAADPFAGVQIALVGAAEASFSASGVASASGSIVAVIERVGSSDGVGAASGTGNAVTARTFSADGVATAVGAVAGIVSAFGTADGLALVSGAIVSIVAAAASTDGTSSASGDPITIVQRVASADGIGSALGSPIIFVERLAASVSLADALGAVNVVTERIGSAAGLATVLGASISVVNATFLGNGFATVTGVPVAVVELVAEATAGASASGVAHSIAERIASALATAEINGVAVQVVQADGIAAGVADVLGDGTGLEGGSGETAFSAAGLASALGAGIAVVGVNANSQGVADVLGAVATIVAAFGMSGGSANVVGFGAGVAPPSPNSHTIVRLASRDQVVQITRNLLYYKCLIVPRIVHTTLEDRNHNAYISLSEVSMSQITRYKGDTAPDFITVHDTNGAPLNIAGYQFVMTIVREREGGPAIFGIDGVITNAAGGVVKFTPSESQASLAPGKYFYGVRMWDTSGAILTILTGQYLIRPSMHGS